VADDDDVDMSLLFTAHWSAIVLVMVERGCRRYAGRLRRNLTHPMMTVVLAGG
jgi:hypothetical protein